MNRTQAAYLLTPIALVAGLFAAPAIFAKPDFSASSPAVIHGTEVAGHGTDPTAVAEAAYAKHRPTAPAAAPAPVATGTAVTISGRTYVPCATEDYEGPDACFWDAGARSNGSGLSFLWDTVGTTYLTAGLPECADEGYDGPDACYWDADRGNGTGRSFIWTGAEVLYNVG